MRSVGLKVLKNKLSEYVRLAARGETVLITDRDQVVAELVPPQAGRAETVSDAQLADLVRNGYLRPALTARGPLPASTPVSTPVSTLGELLGELDADRSDR